MEPVANIQKQMEGTPLNRIAEKKASLIPYRRLLRSKSLLLGGLIVGGILISALFAPILAPYSPTAQDYSAILHAPSAKHWLGTDDLGRDIFSRVLFGARTSMEVSFGAMIVGLIVGIPVGLFSGYYRGFLDDWVIMRIVDALQAFPFLILALVLAAVLGPGIGNAMIAIGVGYLPIFVRTVRAQVIAEMRKDYVEAARVVGMSDWRIMRVHIFPNITTPLIVQAAIAMGSGIVAEASLSYLGLGVEPPTASWGSMLHTAQGYMTDSPWFAIVPGIAIVIAVLGFNLLGEGLQDWFDPKTNE